MMVKNVRSVLKFNLWQPGENTLVGRIVKIENLPESIFLINTGKTGFMQTDSGLLIGDKYKSTDMIKTFSSSKERDKYVKSLSDNIYDSFKNTYLEAVEADIGKDVCIETPSNMKGILRAVTTDGKYVVEADELRIVDKAWIKTENKARFHETRYVDGRVLYTYEIVSQIGWNCSEDIFTNTGDRIFDDINYQRFSKILVKT